MLTINIVSEGTGILPVFKTRVGISVATSHDEGEEYDGHDDDDFDAREPELELAKESAMTFRHTVQHGQLAYTLDAAKVIYAKDGYEEDGNEHARIYFFGLHPVLYDQSSCSKLVWSDNDIFEPV